MGKRWCALLYPRCRYVPGGGREGEREKSGGEGGGREKGGVDFNCPSGSHGCVLVASNLHLQRFRRVCLTSEGGLQSTVARIMADKVKPWVTGLHRELKVGFPVNKVNCLVSETRRKLQVTRGKK